MKFSRSDFEMQRFDSRRPSQPVRLQRVTYEGRLKTARRAGSSRAKSTGWGHLEMRRHHDAQDVVRGGPGADDSQPQVVVAQGWGMKIARHRGMKRAIVAVARRLAVIMHRMWVDGTEFRLTREDAAAT
jgi:hypothetical protein